MKMTEPRFRNLCSYWTRLSETPRCVALNDYYEPQYSMWSRCNIVIPLMNWECVAFFRPRTFSKDQLEYLNLLRTGRPDADYELARFTRFYCNAPHSQCVTNSAMLKSYIKSPTSADRIFAGFPPIPLQHPDQYGYSRPLLNLLLPIIAPKAADPVEVGTFNPEHSIHTILYVRSRFDGNTFWLNDRPAAPRKENAK